MQRFIRRNIAVTAALIGVLELLGALGCLITTLLLGNVTNTDLQAGQLYAKYYDSSSPTRRFGENGGTYWWIGLPFLLPGMFGIAASATRKFSVMLAFMVTNIISFFAGIALAIFVGLFYNLWKVALTAYETDNCVFEYHEPTRKTFCQCSIVDKDHIKLMDADRMWIYVQACDEVELIGMMLIIIIVLAIMTSVLALVCSFVAVYALRTPEKPKSQPKTGFHPLPANFRVERDTQPEERPMMAQNRPEPVLQARDDFDMKPTPQYASQYPPPYQSTSEEPVKRPPSDEEEEGIDGGWL